MTANRIRPILRWPGGKTRLLKRLLPKVPEHTCYCEPFAGGLALLLAKQPSPVEVVNDLNGDLVALYRNVQYHLPALLQELEFMFAARKNISDFTQQPGLTEIQRAARFLVRNRTSFAGHMTSYGVVRTQGGGADFDRRKVGDLLGPAHDRLANVHIENLSYERCLELYDSKDTFFFCDPPYLGANIHAYDAWKEHHMTDFRRRLDKLQGRWVVTVDGSEFNRELFKDCRVEAVESRSGAVNQRVAKRTFSELVITAA